MVSKTNKKSASLVLIIFTCILTNCKKSPSSIHHTNDQMTTTSFTCSNENFTYARVDITYDSNIEMLTFNSLEDFFTVSDALNSEYEAHNDNFEELYSSYNENQLE